MKNLSIKILIILLTLSANLLAQHPNAIRDYNVNHMLWFQLAINGKFKRDGKWSYQLEFEERRQADPQFAPDPDKKEGFIHWNIFKHPYQNAFRPFIHFQPNEKIRFSWSPITWFASWSFPVDGKVTYQ